MRLADGGLRMLSEPMELPAEAVHAGVSSFGLGGTNCHMVLASAPARRTRAGGRPAPASSPCRRTLQRALRHNALQLADDIENSDAPLAQLCWSTNRIKASGKARLAIVVADRDRGRRRAARRASRSGTAAGMSTGWLFSGQGTQYPGMATALYESSAVFRDAFDEVDDGDGAAPWSLESASVMNDERVDRTEFAQPAIFALQYAQARALLRLGAEPAWLLGHSIGEYAAAAIAEVFSLDDACRLVVARGRLMQQLPAGGGMLAVRASCRRRVAGVPASISPR